MSTTSAEKKYACFFDESELGKYDPRDYDGEFPRIFHPGDAYDIHCVNSGTITLQCGEDEFRNNSGMYTIAFECASPYHHWSYRLCPWHTLSLALILYILVVTFFLLMGAKIAFYMAKEYYEEKKKKDDESSKSRSAEGRSNDGTRNNSEK